MTAKDIWTFLLVTLVTVLIWVWAAGETRQTLRIVDARVQFTVSDPGNWVIRPEQQSLVLDIRGSQLGVRDVQNLLRQPLPLDIPANAGRQTIDLFDLLRQHEEILDAGVTVMLASPRYAEVEMDPIERFTAPVKANLPGVTPEGDVTVDPTEVMVAMPSQMRARVGPGFAVEAAPERAELDRLQPGIPHNLDVKVRLPEGFGATNAVTITPSRVRVGFMIRSRTRDIKLDTVRVQLASPPEDRDLYLVDIDPKQLNNVTITADAELARRIESNEVPIIALLHLGSREKETQIESKKISGFIALVPETGGSRMVQVTGKVGDSIDMPAIRLRITKRRDD